MENKQYYTCERNHYFFGKLMTVRDFQTEQVYFNSKRRLGNRMLNGAGIVSGLDVILVDSKTFSLESGMALDYLGREIVVTEPSVKRLNVIKGFEENKDKSDLYLCIGYKENLKESTFSVAGSGKDSGVTPEYNRVEEGYELFLTTKEPDESVLGLNYLIYNKVPIYNKNGISIKMEVSKHVNPCKNLKVSIIFEKNNVSSPVKYSFDILGEFFKSSDGGEKLHVEYQETEVSTYKKIQKDYYLTCDAVSDIFSDVIVKKDSFSIEIGKESDIIESDIKQQVMITTRSLKDVVIENYYAKHFDEIVDQKEGQYIYLAKFHIISNQSSYFIEAFDKHPFKQYVLSNELLSAIQGLETSNSTSGQVLSYKPIEQPVMQVAPDVSSNSEMNVITGVEKINLGINPKVGKSYYSYEFVHGLGYGKVGVITAIENKANYLTNDDNILLFGSDGVFSSEEFSFSTPNAQVGAIVNPDKGTMKLGIKLLEKANVQSIDVRWWAFKPLQTDAEKEGIIVDDNIKVVISPNTTRVEPLGQIRFTAEIEGSSSQEVSWSVTESGAGTIDSNGLYTAPSKEGVYEIKAESVKFEGKSDSAYVVVSASE